MRKQNAAFPFKSVIGLWLLADLYEKVLNDVIELLHHTGLECGKSLMIRKERNHPATTEGNPSRKVLIYIEEYRLYTSTLLKEPSFVFCDRTCHEDPYCLVTYRIMSLRILVLSLFYIGVI
jgi:hypothetical protein